MPDRIGEPGPYISDIRHDDRWRNGGEIGTERSISEQHDAASDASSGTQMLGEPQQDRRGTAAGGLVADEDHVGHRGAVRKPFGGDRRMPQPLPDPSTASPQPQLGCGHVTAHTWNAAKHLGQMPADFHDEPSVPMPIAIED